MKEKEKSTDQNPQRPSPQDMRTTQTLLAVFEYLLALDLLGMFENRDFGAKKLI
ncbi:hypothetical protein N9X90_03530 [Alphaproteobacteria bacterium]|nr:hypothetical protein [Alphaproteobacteria bacterium]